MAEIIVAAAIILDAQGRMLVVRKDESLLFQQPGGKIDVGETPEMAVRREVAEEVSITLAPSSLCALGIARAPAANEPDHMVVAHLFAAQTEQTPFAAAEIAEIAWLDVKQPSHLNLAPLLKMHVIPLVRRLALTGADT